MDIKLGSAVGFQWIKNIQSNKQSWAMTWGENELLRRKPIRNGPVNIFDKLNGHSRSKESEAV